jgi:hypothetical protein
LVLDYTESALARFLLGWRPWLVIAFFNFKAGTLATESELGAADDLLYLEKAFFLSSVNF